RLQLGAVSAGRARPVHRRRGLSLDGAGGDRRRAGAGRKPGRAAPAAAETRLTMSRKRERGAGRNGRIEPMEPIPASDDAIVLRLAYRAPYDWPAMLSFLRERAVDGVEHVEGEVYRRTVQEDEVGR